MSLNKILKDTKQPTNILFTNLILDLLIKLNKYKKYLN